ncbi:MAG: autotransporter outer membrane beta-barrel domain-containing protein [Synechococcus sp.]|nr:autotransporter outer membrane beta-barrel domain-containing protein [Synechococcus sp.]
MPQLSWIGIKARVMALSAIGSLAGVGFIPTAALAAPPDNTPIVGAIEPGEYPVIRRQCVSTTNNTYILDGFDVRASPGHNTELESLSPWWKGNNGDAQELAAKASPTWAFYYDSWSQNQNNSAPPGGSQPNGYTSSVIVPENQLQTTQINNGSGWEKQNNRGLLFYWKSSDPLYYNTEWSRNRVGFITGYEFGGECNEGGFGSGSNITELLEDVPPDVAAKLLSGLKNRDRIAQFIAATLPRNVIVNGGLSTQAYVNDLADTILERLPMRHFTPVQVDEQISELEAKESTGEPVRGFWKTSSNGEESIELASLTLGETTYREDPNPSSIYTEPFGSRAWVRGFGGGVSPFKTGGGRGRYGLLYYPDVYNDSYSSHAGIVAGIDTSISKNLQLGIFGNYGHINVQHFPGEYSGRGSWTPNGYGGGVMASYWLEHFYVQGLLGATAFSGENQREIRWDSAQFSETYTATKNTTSYMGALRVGAPLNWGSMILEPQLTAIWNGNHDASYTESGRYRSLALKINDYQDNFLRTALGAKVAWPQRYSNGNLLVPNIKLAWLADWNTGNGDLTFQRAYSRLARKITGHIPTEQNTQNGVLVEGGVDYSIFRSPTSAWKLYAKGGAKLWTNKQADWRASGGISFQF